MAMIMSTRNRYFSILLLFGIFLQTCSSIEVYEVFKNMKLVPDLLPHLPPRLCKVTYTSDAGTLVLKPGQQFPVEYRNIHPNVTWPTQKNKTYCLYMAGSSRWIPAPLDKFGKSVVKPKPITLPTGTTYPHWGHEWHNWIVGNIPNNDVASGQVLYHHLPIINPPTDFGVDRYAFLVFEQVFGLINFTPPIDGKAYQFQELSRVYEFAQHYMLGNPVFGNCFTNKWFAESTTK